MCVQISLFGVDTGAASRSVCPGVLGLCGWESALGTGQQVSCVRCQGRSAGSFGLPGGGGSFLPLRAGERLAIAAGVQEDDLSRPPRSSPVRWPGCR